MKPAREPASSSPKPGASSPFAAPCGARRNKNDRSQTSIFSSETSRSTPLILADRGSSLPWLVDDRAALSPSPNLVRLPATVLPVSSAPPPSRRAPNWSSEAAHTWDHHPQPTIPPPRLNRQAESQRQPVGRISRGRVRPYTRRKDSSTFIHPKPGFGGGGQEEENLAIARCGSSVVSEIASKKIIFPSARRPSQPYDHNKKCKRMSQEAFRAVE